MSTVQLRVNPPVWPMYFKEADKKEAAWQIDQCVKWLHSQGFEIVSVQAGSRNPRIIIRSSQLCEGLEGAVRRYERIGMNETRYWVAIRFDCEVRWTDMGDAK